MTGAFLESWYLWVAPLVLAVWALVRWIRPRGDVKRPRLDADLDWNGTPEAALQRVYDYVVAFSDGVIGWYRERRQPKRYYGVSLRVAALFFTAGAGLVPLAPDLGGGVIAPVWSTVLLAAAGLFVSVDALGGFTSGWVRYILAQQRVERLRDGFLLEWNALRIEKATTGDLLARAKAFLLAVGKVVDDETQEWATEFRNALNEMERARKAEAETERTGAIEVTVKNPDAVTGWVLEVDGGQRGQTTARRLAVTGVPVGLRRLKVHGTDAQGKPLSDETSVKVDGGATVSRELELS